LSNGNKADDEIYDKLYEMIQSAVQSEVQRTLAQQGGSQGSSGAGNSDTAHAEHADISQLSEAEIAARIAAMAESSDDSDDDSNYSNDIGTKAVTAVSPVNTAPADTVHEDDVKSRLVAYYAAIHEKNRKRIKTGMICMFVIPVVFLILLFTMQSSKIVYLVLWIASLFILCGYLIAVEYSDYSLQEKLEALGVDEHGVDGSLIGPDVLEKDIQSMKERMGL
jgi:small-conductance mechanosensitive channel